MLKRKKKIIIRNYEQLCFPVTTSGMPVLKENLHLKIFFEILYIDIFHTTILGNYKIILKPEVLQVNCVLKQLWRN